MKLLLALLGILMTLNLSNCSSINTKINSTPLPLIRTEFEGSSSESGLIPSVIDTLTIEQAINLALENNPQIKAAFLNIKAHEARATQASSLINPEFEFEIESSDFTIGIGQVVELGNKRQFRTQIANSKSRQVALEYEMMRLDLVTDIREIYTRISTEQARLNLLEKLLEISERFNAKLDTLVKAGRFSSAERSRSEVEHQNLLLRRLQVESSLRQKKQELAATWGGTAESVGGVIDLLDEPKRLPSRATILKALKTSPAIMLADLEMESREVETKYARSLRIPDPTFSAGLRRIQETNDQALVAGISVPIPILNRNKAGIEEAQFRHKQSEELLNSENLQGLKKMNSLLESLETLSLMTETLSMIIIPAAESTYETINQNYKLGQYGLIYVIDSQRQLIDAQLQYLETRLEYNNNIIQLEGLLGRSIKSL